MFSWARKLKKNEGIEENNKTAFKASVRCIFAYVCFSGLKGSTYETRKNVFCFISKALFILGKIEV